MKKKTFLKAFAYFLFAFYLFNKDDDNFVTIKNGTTYVNASFISVKKII